MSDHEPLMLDRHILYHAMIVHDNNLIRLGKRSKNFCLALAFPPQPVYGWKTRDLSAAKLMKPWHSMIAETNTSD